MIKSIEAEIKGADIANLLEQAASYSATTNGVTRLYASVEHKAILEFLRQQMELANMQVHLDAIGNLIGFKQGVSDKKIILGSHQDTVIHGGKYDGIMGIILPIYIMQQFEKSKIALDFSVEIIAFGDEEGVRFPDTMLGSKAVSGKANFAWLDLVDKDGISVKEALTGLGCNTAELEQCSHKSDDIMGYVEVHIEQGPVLEEQNLPVCLVSAIAGMERHSVKIVGQANHAGTFPMDKRSDALVAMANIISKYDEYCKNTDNVVGVIGKIHNYPNAANVIPDLVEFTLESRSPHKEIRLKTREFLQQLYTQTQEDFKVKCDYEVSYEMEGALADINLKNQLGKAMQKHGIKPMEIFSGAGHDGLAVADLTKIAMMFVRCKDGRSHTPDEFVKTSDLEISAKVLADFLQNLNS